METCGGLSQARPKRIGVALRQPIERGEFAGLVALAARGDAIHVETLGVQDVEARTPMRRDTIFRIASMTKPIIAAAAMILVEEARIRLDESVEHWLPELANRRVLRSIESALDHTAPAARPITLRDLLTFRLGLGAVMAPPGTYPIQTAMAELGVAPGPDQLPFTPDEFMTRIGDLPLIHQPGERWMYHTGIDVLAVLIARAAAMPLEEFLRERIFAPLGMNDTGFTVPPEKIARLATCYMRNAKGELDIWDAAEGGRYTRAPSFPNALVSTVDDYLAFSRMLLNRGRHNSVRVLSRPSVTLMLSDQLTDAQKAAWPFFPGFWDNKGWGFGGAVVTRRDSIFASPGQYGWMGGFGTSFVVDPAENVVAILMLQRLMAGPNDTKISDDFLTLAYQAIDD
jgi:CubicO group peptidase (beta-lactamase class C family)